MDYRYIELNHPLITDVMWLFDSEKGLGGTSSLSLRTSTEGDGRSIVLVCLEKESLIGAIEFSPIDRDEVRIRNLVVIESFRCKGIGSELLSRVELKIAQDYDPEYIRTIPMPYSFSLFSKFGYVIDEANEYDWLKIVSS